MFKFLLTICYSAQSFVLNPLSKVSRLLDLECKFSDKTCMYILQLKEMAERLPQGAFRHARSGSMSGSRLDTTNGTHAGPDVLAQSDGERGAQVPHKFSVNTTINARETNGVSSPHSASSPRSGRDTHSLGSPRSTSSPRAVPDNEIGGLQSRVATSMRVANRAMEGDANGFEAQRSEEGGRAVGTTIAENGREHETEWVEQDEPGVYITLTALPGGGKDLKRVRFR